MSTARRQCHSPALPCAYRVDGWPSSHGSWRRSSTSFGASGIRTARALDAIEAALLAIGLAELAKRQQRTIEELSTKLWQTQQELARYQASVRFQLAAEDRWRTADHISEWERELRD